MQLEPGRNAMNRRDVLSLSATTALGLALLPSSATGQQKSLKEQLVGSWAFVSAADTNKDGTKTNRWGPNPKGLGRYAFMISRASARNGYGSSRPPVNRVAPGDCSCGAAVAIVHACAAHRWRP